MRVALKWILEQAWASTPEALEGVIKIADREDELMIAGAKLPAELSAVFHKSAVRLPQGNAGRAGEMDVRNGIAVLSVFGPIFPRANLMTELSGATSAQMLGEQFKAAMSDPNVHGILFQVDSPGGAVTGISELSDIIRAGGKQKPVKAFVQGMGASAAYWISSAAGEVVMGDTAEAGSIGVVAAFKDTRDKDAKEGVKTIEVVSSVSPLKRVGVETVEGRAKVQRLVDDIAQVFVQHVAQNRGTNEENVKQNFGRGDMFIGAKAVAQGMADRVGTFDAVLAEMQTASMSGQTKPKRKGMKMSGENEPTLSAEELLTQHPSAVAEIQRKAAEAERERIIAIEAVKAPGYDNVIAENKFKPGMTADKMSALILAAQNDKATVAADKVKTDAEKLAQQSAGTGGDAGGADRETTEALERANAVKNMTAGIDSKRSN